MQTTDTNFYLTTALQALEAAHRVNHDLSVATHLSQAMDALHRIAYQAGTNERRINRRPSDPYEMDEFNSAV